MKNTRLTEHERYQIYSLIKAGITQNLIAIQLNRHPSTISRELRRNLGKKGYRPKQAHQLSVKRRLQKNKHVKLTQKVKSWIERLVKLDLSPEQVCCYLQRHKNISLHHETIYRYVFSDKSRTQALKPYLRQGKKIRRKRYGSGARASLIPNRTSIQERPQVVDDKRRIGDWECDTVIGKDRKSALVTIVERKSLFTLMATVKRKTAEQVSRTMIRLLKPYESKVKTLTFDNGTEFTLHEKVAKALSAKTYFANPYSSWERGINENTNGLIRQFFPKGINFTDVKPKEVKTVISLINNRPRKTRKYKSPNEIFNHQFVPLLT